MIVKERNAYLMLALLGAVLFLPFLGRVHLFDWDEINFAEMAREMVVSGNYMKPTVDFEPFWEKPPLFLWLQAAAMNIFGVGEFAARLPNALTGIATLLIVYAVGTRVQDARLGLLWVLAYIGSLLPHFYFRSGIIDPLFNLFMFLGVVFIARGYEAGNNEAPRKTARLKQIVFSGLFIGLAMLTKGPVGLLLPGLTWAAYWLMHARTLRFPIIEGVVWVAVAVLVTAVWYGYDLVVHGAWFLNEFIQYQIRLFTTDKEAGHVGPFYYHFVVLLVGCFPASALFWPALRTPATQPDNANLARLRTLLIILLCVTLVVFSISKEKIVHYSSLCYFPLTFLAALSLHRMLYGGAKPKAYVLWLLGILGFVWALAMLALPLVGLLKSAIIPLLKDKFAAANLQADVHWTGLEFLPGLVFAAAIGYAIYKLRMGADLRRAAVVLFGGVALTICLLLPWIVPKVEGYSQRAAIEFFESKRGCNCYVATLDYKSYAHYFYGDRQPRYSPRGAGVPVNTFIEWLLTGPIDADAYFVTKIDRVEPFRDKAKYPDLQEVGSKNGFVFFMRPAAKK
jgi:4-amino-4-deoxy-L-arabinose transferase-like glycosyltransferase